MTTEEALNFIKSKRNLDADFVDDRKAIGVAVEALEKQIPMKPKAEKEMWYGYSITNNKDYFCPNCKTLLTTDYIAEFFNFCDECGQAIDWEEV